MLRKKGGDTRAAAALSGKVVGRPLKPDAFKRQIKLPLHADDDDSLAAFAEVDGVTKQDLIRLAISRYLIDRRIV